MGSLPLLLSFVTHQLAFFESSKAKRLYHRQEYNSELHGSWETKLLPSKHAEEDLPSPVHLAPSPPALDLPTEKSMLPVFL